MKLTERQCWDIIRKLVSDKNKEYAKFLSQNVGRENMSLCIGYTKSLYLNKFALSTEREFKYLLKRRGIQPQKEWLDNLSSEDLLLFLDFRCTTLQKMYDFLKIHGSITHEDVINLIAGTKRSSLINYNAGRLKATGRPEAVENEESIEDLGFIEENIEKAISQQAEKIARGHSMRLGVSLQSALNEANKLKTHNINNNGEITGYSNRLMLKLGESDKQEKQKRTVNPDKIHLVGFDAKKAPIFMIKDQFVDIVGKPIPPVEIVYDLDKNKIEQDVQGSNQVRFVGFDIQGSPVYEDEYGYFNSIGERLPDDVYIESEEDLFGR